jgi:hypothetical protein
VSCDRTREAGVAGFKWQQNEAKEHRFAMLEVALYGDADRDRMIVKFKDAAPSLQSQAYGRGQGKDVIIEYVSDWSQGAWVSRAHSVAWLIDGTRKPD